MGYLVATTGRLLLPPNLERQALTVAEHRMASRQGWFDPDDEHVDSLADLATFAGVTLTREGEWLTVSTDHGGDPKWSDQAEEFYRALSGFVQDGEVNLRGEDGSTWSYRYSPGGVQQGGDGGGPAGDGASPQAATEPPATSQPDPPAAADPPQPHAQQDPDPDPPGGFSYPGKEQRPPSAAPPPTPPVPSWSPSEDDEAPPASRGRVLAMTALLVVGVLLIIGLALFASGF